MYKYSYLLACLCLTHNPLVLCKLVILYDFTKCLTSKQLMLCSIQ